MVEYILIPELLSSEQCDALVANAQQVPDMAGDMTWKQEPDFPEVRSSRLRWLRRDPIFADAFTAIDNALDHGDQAFGVKTASNPIDAIQFTEYHEARLGHYDWHQDDFHKPYDRLLSICIQLSDPEEYDGGSLELRVNEPPPPEVLGKKGTAIIFPSTTTHRVTQTVRGHRYSAVAWRYGDRPDVPIERSVVVPNFDPVADQMRQAYDTFFNNPSQHGAPHQVFDYWYVPEIYNYLRTPADRIVGQPLVHQFVNAFQAYAEQRFGLRTVTWPYLSIYVNGMFQELHNDAANGVYGYVYSLTHWDRRKFSGGETLLGRPNVFDELEPRSPRGRGNFFESFDANYNQLLIFDDRIPHYVPTIRGTMDPLEARIVLHGHLQK